MPVRGSDIIRTPIIASRYIDIYPSYLQKCLGAALASQLKRLSIAIMKEAASSAAFANVLLAILYFSFTRNKPCLSPNTCFSSYAY